MSKFSHTQLGDCCEIVSGATPKTGVGKYWDGDVLWATPKDLSDLSGIYIDDTPRKITEAGLKSCSAFALPVGSVLFSSRAPIGHVAINTRPLATNQGFKSFIPKTDRVDAKYLAHWLKANRLYLESLGNGATFKEVSKATIAKVEIPLPSLGEQRRIAQALNSVDALRAKRRAAIALLDDLAQSIFLEMFSTDYLRYRRVDFPTAFWFQEGPGIRKWQFTESGVKLLNVGNIEKSGKLNLSKTNRRISVEETCGRYSHFLVDAGDLVIASSGISIDDDGMLRTRGSFVDNSLLPLCMNTSTIRFKSIPNISDLYYLRSWLNSIEFRGQITRLVTGSAQLNFGPSHLKSLKISLPEITTQQEFAKKIKKLDSGKFLLSTHLAELDALFVSLQYRAFRGELWDDPLF